MKEARFMISFCRPTSNSLIMGLLTLTSALLISEISHADPYQDAQQRFSAYRERAFKLQSHVNTKYIVGELNTLNQWVSEAERHLRDEDEDEFVRAVKLIRVQLRLVDISLEELDAREQILRLTEEATRMEKKAKNEREAVVEIEKMMGGSLSSPPAQMPAQGGVR
jgi:hypothetical protein